MKTKLLMIFPLVLMLFYPGFNTWALDSIPMTKDGGYILTSINEYIAMAPVKYSSTKIKNDSKEAPNFIYRYVLNPKSNTLLSTEDVSAIFIKGNHQAHHFSLHKLEERTLLTKEQLANNNGKANINAPFYYVGKEIIAVQRKRTEHSRSNFFFPKKSLTPGRYVIWIDWVFWIFEVK